MFKDLVLSIEKRLMNLPAPLFWLMFCGLTWFYLIRRTISWDLWWHMAAGRYYLEHDFYPPPGSFTYSDVNEADALLDKTWLGDVVFHWCYQYWPTDPIQVLKIFTVVFAIFLTFKLVKTLSQIRQMLDSALPSSIAMFVPARLVALVPALLIVILPASKFILFTCCFLYVCLYLWDKGLLTQYKYIPWLHLPLALAWVYTISKPLLETVFFGDVLGYMSNEWGQFGGLQILRIVLIMSAVYFFLSICNFKKNIWTLFACVIIVIGTTQLHLTKNALYGALFISMLGWAWIRMIFFNQRYLIWFFPPVMILWSHMHGYAKLGAILMFLMFFGLFLDTIVDICRWIIDKAMEKTPKVDIFVTVVFLVIVGINFYYPYQDIDERWGIGLEHNIDTAMNKFFPESEVSSGGEASSGGTGQTARPVDAKQRLKGMLRIIFTGIDAERVAEYQWPLSNTFVFSTKLIIVLAILYACFLVLRLTILQSNFRFSIEIPALVLAYFGLGYLRTMGPAFLLLFIFMGLAFCRSKILDKDEDASPGLLTRLLGLITEKDVKELEYIKRIIRSVCLIILCLILYGLYNSFELIQVLLKMFDDGLSLAPTELFVHEGQMPFVQYLIYPFVIAVPIIALIYLIPERKYFLIGIRSLIGTLGCTVLVCLTIYMGITNYKYVRDDFQKVSGFLDTEQGIGKSNKFFYGAADYVEKHYPNEHTFNTYNMGGFLLWKWYGKRKVFIDGRSAIYDIEFYKRYTRNELDGDIAKHKLRAGIFNFVVDKHLLKYFMYAKRWYPVAFDTSMVVLERADKLEDSYGKELVRLPDEREMKRLEYLDRQHFGMFIDLYLRQMLLMGRMKDAKKFLADYNHLIEGLPQNFQQSIAGRARSIHQGIQMFGEHNDRVFAPVWSNAFNNYNGLGYTMSIAHAAKKVKRYKLAASHYMQSIRILTQINEKKKKLELAMQKGEKHIQELVKQNKWQAMQLTDKEKGYLKSIEEWRLHLELADSLFHLRDASGVINAYNAALKIERNTTLFNRYTVALINMLKYPEALQVCKEGLKYFPNNHELYFNMAMIHFRNKNYEESKTAMLKVIQLAPNFGPARQQLQVIEKAIKEKKPAN